MEKSEIKKLAEYADKVADRIPRGLVSLKDAVSFSVTDLLAYSTHGFKGRSFNKALTFIKSIPVTDDLDSDEFSSWMIHDRLHLEYWKD